MFGSETLEVAIGIVFVFLLFSIICTAVREGLESFLKSRAAYLDYGLKELLDDPDGTQLVAQLYNHPLIYGLFPGPYTGSSRGVQPNKAPGLILRGGNLPAYIPSKNFAMAIFDLAARGGVTTASGVPAIASAVVANTPNAELPALSVKLIRANIANLRNPRIERAVLLSLDTARDDLDLAAKNLGDWFNSSMDRVSGWYKRSSQMIIFLIALGGAVACNVNTLAVLDYLHTHEAAREAITAQASVIAKGGSKADLPDADNSLKKLNALKIPIGWDDPLPSGKVNLLGIDLPWRGLWSSLGQPILGWLLTALAASLGAPFWFDALNKLMIVRSTVKPQEKSGEEASKDPQGPLSPIERQIDLDPEPEPDPPSPAAQSPVAKTPPLGIPPSPKPPSPNAGVDDSDLDGYQVVAETITEDHELPAATGGVE